MSNSQFNPNDWEIVNDNEKSSNQSAFNPADWEMMDNEQPSSNEGFSYKLPRNVAIGLTHAGRNLHNLPHDLSKLAEWPAEKLFGPLKNPLSSYLPNDVNDYADIFGQKGSPTWGDKAIQKGVEYAPDIIGGLNALRGLKLLPHLTKRGATKKLKQAQQTFKDWAESGKSTGKLNVNPELIEDARQYLPNNLDERHLLSNATNDYEKLFNLQSQVGKVSAERMGKLRSIFAPETHMKGKAGLAARRNLINAMHENLQSEGLLNTSNLLREGQNDYRRYMQFKPYRNAIGLAGLGYAGNQIFPKNPLTDLVKKLMFQAANNQ